MKLQFNQLKKNPERQFFLFTGIWFLLLVLGGFGDSFYFSSEAVNILSVHLVVHGVVFSLWILIYLLQCLLISNGDVKVHMLLGKLSVIVVVLVFITGYYAILHKTGAGRKPIPEAGSNLFQVGLGFLFVILALVKRKNPFVHKRLMLIGMVFITIAGVHRLIESFWNTNYIPLLGLILILLPLLALVIFDKLYYKKFKLLSVSLFFFTIAYQFLSPSDYIFNDKYGQTVIDALSKVFLW